MNVERLNDNQIRFVIPAQELNARGISVSDILTRTNEKAQGLFQEITTMLQNQYGFSTVGTPLVFEATVSQDALSVLVTRTTGQEGMGVPGGFAGFQGVGGTAAQMPKWTHGVANPPNGTGFNAGQQAPSPVQSGYAVYSFEDLDMLAAATARIGSAYCGSSHVYKMEGRYFLILQNEGKSIKSIRRFDAPICEFGKREVSSLLSYSRLQEYGEIMIANDAVAKMKIYYGVNN